MPYFANPCYGKQVFSTRIGQKKVKWVKIFRVFIDTL